MDIEQAPKQFCENVTTAFSKEFFATGLSSGGTTIVYAFTPEHMKRLVQHLAYNLENYEKQFGTIDAEWNPNVKSPIQAGDLSGGDSSGKASE